MMDKCLTNKLVDEMESPLKRGQVFKHLAKTPGVCFMSSDFKGEHTPDNFAECSVISPLSRGGFHSLVALQRNTGAAAMLPDHGRPGLENNLV